MAESTRSGMNNLVVYENARVSLLVLDNPPNSWFQRLKIKRLSDQITATEIIIWWCIRS